MNAESVFCSGCSTLIPADIAESGTGRCRTCGAALRVKTFPALRAQRTPLLAQGVQDPSESSCFYHAENRATVPCDGCGRFLCGLCALDVPGSILCPSCLQSGVSGKRIETLEDSRTMQDSVALALATVPAVMVWPTIVSAPLAIFWTIRHWRSPRSIIPRTRVRFYLAIVFSLLEIAFLAFLVFAAVMASRLTR